MPAVAGILKYSKHILTPGNTGFIARLPGLEQKP